ncbi:MAG: AcvB/VirJ family lysyl-phosphatidylglycerol hydrolase [Pseudomonadota bacterium]
MTILRYCLLLPFFLASMSFARADPAAPAEETFSFAHFGDVHVYRNSAQPKHVVLFVSGDGGWNLGVIDMARSLAGLDALVAGIDITAYLKNIQAVKAACCYPAADFEGLSQYLQKRYNYPDYVQPVLVGYSSGATLVYATLAQVPPNTFRGGISLGFCPDLPLTRPLCRGNGLKFTPAADGKGYDFLPDPSLTTPWVALQGDIDQVCDAKATATFVSQTGNARLVNLPGVGHGYSVQKNWLPQFHAAFTQLVADARPPQTAKSADLEDLPLVEITVKQPGRTFAVIVSGDGGWASIDKSLADSLASEGIPTVGLDSLHYFWTRRTEDEMGRDLTAIVQHYLAAWHKDRVLLIGYSRGADVLPFMASRLPSDLREHTALVALLGAEHGIDFEFRVADWLPGSMQDAPHQVLPEVEKLSDYRVLCIYGEDEPAPLCPDLDPGRFTVHKLAGGHHFGGDYAALADLILQTASP